MRASAAGSRSRSFADALVGGLVFLVLGVVGFHLLRRGINLSDEGFLLMEVVDMLDGKVLYRDIETFHAPGIWLLLAGLFAVVEPSVLASRGAAALSYFAVAALIFRLVQKRAGLRYGFAGVAVYTALSVWSFPQWTWTWFSPYAVLFSLLAMHSLLAWRDDRRTRRLLVVGFWIGLAAAFKQNYGFFALVASLVGLLALRIEAREQPLRALRAGLLDSLGIGAGVLVAFLPFLLYFGYHGALFSILDLERFILYPLDFTTVARIPYLDFSALWSHGIFEDRGTSTNYLAQLALSTPTTIPLLPSLTEIRVLHAILYWLPPLVLAAGLVLSLLPKSPEKPIDGELFVSTALSGLLFLGIFPRADFTHLVTVYQPLLVTGALVAHRVISRLPERLPSWAWVPVTSGVALFGFYALAAAAWLLYLVDSMVEELPQRRGGVLVHTVTAAGINQLVEVVRAHTGEGEPFFGIPDMAMINFLSERPVPGSQYQTYAHMISRDGGALTTRQLAEADVRFAIARYDNVLSTEPRLAYYAPVLASYLERNFEATWMIQNDQYLLLQRREEPHEPIETQSVLDSCRFAGGDAPKSSVREHLLFRSLFQPLTPSQEQQSAETHCRVRVPENATLAVQISYKRPEVVDSGAELEAEVFAVVDGVRERLIREVLSVESVRREGVPVPPKRRADLSHLAGRELDLVFRTARRGVVEMGPFTLETYAMFWQDPVLELGTSRGGP